MKPLLLPFILWILVSPAWATVGNSTQTAHPAATQWHLSTTQWAHYQTLMQGAAGKKYPQLTPPEVLGIVAKTTTARRHYAELVVAQQKKQLTQELAFNRAVQEAWHRLYPDLKPIAPFDMRAFAPK